MDGSVKGYGAKEAYLLSNKPTERQISLSAGAIRGSRRTAAYLPPEKPTFRHMSLSGGPVSSRAAR
jgi:hypothetical protein